MIYASNPLLKKLAVQKRYRKQRSVILQKRKSHYYASLKCRRAARLLRYAMHHSSENAKNKLYRQVNKKNVLKARRARYSLPVESLHLHVQGRVVIKHLSMC